MTTRLECVDLDDALVAAADQLWPDSTWSEVIEYALSVVIADAQHTNTDTAEAVVDLEDQLEARLAATFASDPA